METTQLAVLSLAVLFLAAFVRSALGFGDALVAMPLLALFVEIKTATPLVALSAFTIALSILSRAWRQVNVRAAWRLVLSTLAGIPLGLLLLKFGPESWLKGILGAVLIGFGSYNLLRFKLPELRGEGSSYLFGFAAGILGGAYNTNGPPVVIYGVMRRWPPPRFRATLQGYFLVTGGTIMISHGITGLWTEEVLRLFAYALPVILAGVVLGGWAHRKLDGERFRAWVNAFLAVMGFAMFL